MRRSAALLLTPLVTVVMFAGAAPAAAEVNFNTRQIVEEFRINSCDGTFIVLTGWLHGVNHLNKDGSQDLYVNEHVTGVAEDGTRYLLNGQRKVHNEFDPPSGVFEVHTMLVSQGSAPNEQVVITFPFPEGEFEIDTECRG